MRGDISDTIKFLVKEEPSMFNKAELARRYNCDPRTIDRYIKIHTGKLTPAPTKRTYPSKLDPYKETIINKVDKFGCSAMAVYKFIQKKGYDGRYSILADFVKKHKDGEVKKATIRFETNPGASGTGGLERRYVESLFKTLKYRPNYQPKGFETLEEAREWVSLFVKWYNHDHHHSGLNFLTPYQRRSGLSDKILSKRKEVYEAAKAEHPERWNGRATRDWSLPDTVYLNPDKVHEQSERADEQMAVS